MGFEPRRAGVRCNGFVAGPGWQPGRERVLAGRRTDVPRRVASLGGMGTRCGGDAGDRAACSFGLSGSGSVDALAAWDSWGPGPSAVGSNSGLGCGCC
ncbi:hypothetical protein AZ78_1893 [Lysobacter capsici AZ78]|uniref:Uncharacterized protein n=1 Tax=Lysobacter capsici AZ78 TaxID=1444315 RepID=A0A108U877_9GAMM|nr:hypothetical protein AZ78_1893 [Lysobacter capsici AZ78]